MKNFRFLIVIFFLTLIAGCKTEGCTDKDALNFNITADSDDGSCVYCPEGSGEPILLDYGSVVEWRSNTMYEDVEVLEVKLKQEGVRISQITNCDGANQECLLTVTFKNISGATLQNFQVSMVRAFPGFSIESNIYLDTVYPDSEVQRVFSIGSGGSQSCFPITDYDVLEFQVYGGFYEE